VKIPAAPPELGAGGQNQISISDFDPAMPDRNLCMANKWETIDWETIDRSPFESWEFNLIFFLNCLF
jgi:hypothetical protein